jgi:lipopolysaccharide transport system ATP-binding protein
MSDIALRVENLGKMYRIGAPQRPAVNFAQAITQTLTSPFAYLLSTLREPTPEETLWALKDVSFQMKQGEVIGVIGRNGAGKSTLLKLLSRITEPTTGRAEIYGRVGSLLEVGTGFHPDLTGRENIYMNGSILGMTRAEIKRKFDEIVVFSGVEKFIDTPVKRYSSGMGVRLGFAVAAHLESEILIVDEVLAVGDAQFRNKCLGKMRAVSGEGRTVLFVSHNMAIIENLCANSILLEQGKVVAFADTSTVIATYMKAAFPDENKVSLAESMNRSGSGDIRFTTFHLEDLTGQQIPTIRSGQGVVLVFEYEAAPGARLSNVSVGFSFHSHLEQVLFILYNDYTDQTFAQIPSHGQFKCHLSRFPLTPGRYQVGVLGVVNGTEADWPKDKFGVTVEMGDFFGTGSLGATEVSNALFLVDGDWSVKSLNGEQQLPDGTGSL